MKEVQRVTITDVVSPGTVVRAINKNLDFFAREVSLYNSAIIAPGAADQFNIGLGKSARIITVTSNQPGLLSVYGSGADRTSNTRPQLVLTLSNLVGGVLGGSVHNLETPVSGMIYCKLVNTGNSSLYIQLKFLSIQMEV